LVIRKSSYKLIELRRAWCERKERATAAKRDLRWKRRAARLRRKPALEKKEAPVRIPAEVPEEKPPEKRTEEKTEIPRALFP